MIGVRVGVAELNGILGKQKIIAKIQSTVISASPSFHFNFVRIILHMMTTSLPILVMNQRFAQRLHSLLEQTILFVLYYPSITKFIIKNLTLPRCRPLLTRKLNHWVYPPELLSFCKIKWYSLSPIYLTAKIPYKLPVSYLLQS